MYLLKKFQAHAFKKLASSTTLADSHDCKKFIYPQVNVDDKILIQTRGLDVSSAVSRNINIHNEAI